jgi:signal transduction histidine kinase
MDIQFRTLTAPFQPMLGLLSRMMTLDPSITDRDTQRRMRLLLVMDIVVLIGNILGMIALLLILKREPRIVAIYLLPSTITIVLITVGFWLSRTANYRRGIYLTVFTIMLNAYAAIVVTPGAEAFGYVAMVIAAPLIASLVLNIRETAQVSVAATLGLMITFVLHGYITPLIFDPSELYTLSPFAQTTSVIITIALSSVVLISMRLRDLVEADRLEAQRLAISEKERAEAFQQADQVKSAFMASMSHELRTPLNAIINFTTFVVDGDTGDVNDMQKELLTEVVGSGRHLLNLINDVLDISKIEAGSLKLFFEDDVDLSEMIASVTKTGQSLIVDKPVHIKSNVDETLPAVRVDRQRIYQILLNILSNACKFTDEGQITIRAQATHDKYVEIAITDTGPGIAAEDISLVFEPFKQTKTGLSNGSGTGLGMPIAQNLAQAHGGEITVESTVGEGSTFRLRIPLVAPERSELPAPVPAIG